MPHFDDFYNSGSTTPEYFTTFTDTEGSDDEPGNTEEQSHNPANQRLADAKARSARQRIFIHKLICGEKQISLVLEKLAIYYSGQQNSNRTTVSPDAGMLESNLQDVADAEVAMFTGSELATVEMLRDCPETLSVVTEFYGDTYQNMFVQAMSRVQEITQDRQFVNLDDINAVVAEYSRIVDIILNKHIAGLLGSIYLRYYYTVFERIQAEDMQHEYVKYLYNHLRCLHVPYVSHVVEMFKRKITPLITTKHVIEEQPLVTNDYIKMYNHAFNTAIKARNFVFYRDVLSKIETKIDSTVRDARFVGDDLQELQKMYKRSYRYYLLNCPEMRKVLKPIPKRCDSIACLESLLEEIKSLITLMLNYSATVGIINEAYDMLMRGLMRHFDRLLHAACTYANSLTLNGLEELKQNIFENMQRQDFIIPPKDARQDMNPVTFLGDLCNLILGFIDLLDIKNLLRKTENLPDFQKHISSFAEAADHLPCILENQVIYQVISDAKIYIERYTSQGIAPRLLRR